LYRPKQYFVKTKNTSLILSAFDRLHVVYACIINYCFCNFSILILLDLLIFLLQFSVGRTTKRLYDKRKKTAVRGVSSDIKEPQKS